MQTTNEVPLPFSASSSRFEPIQPRALSRNDGKRVVVSVTTPGEHRKHRRAAGHAVAGPRSRAAGSKEQQASAGNLTRKKLLIKSFEEVREEREGHTAEKDVSATPLPHVNVPPLTPQLPFEEVMVKLVAVPVMV